MLVAIGAILCAYGMYLALSETSAVCGVVACALGAFLIAAGCPLDK